MIDKVNRDSKCVSGHFFTFACKEPIRWTAHEQIGHFWKLTMSHTFISHSYQPQLLPRHILVMVLHFNFNFSASLPL